MTTSHSMASVTRKIMWPAVVLLAAAAAACGGSTQDLAGTSPSQVSAVATASDTGGSFSLLKQGKGKGRPTPDADETPTTGTTPDPDDPEEDSSDLGKGHGKATIQIEGFSEKIDGTCPNLIISINGLTVNTVETLELTTDFQRATCEALAASTASIHLHIAAKKMDDESLVATSVRMQGPKFDAPDDAEDEEDTTN